MSSTASGDGKRDRDRGGEEGMMWLPVEGAGAMDPGFDPNNGLAVCLAVVRGGVIRRAIASFDELAACPVVAREGAALRVSAPIDGEAVSL